MIKIETKKVIAEDGKQKRILTKVKMLNGSDLPELYIDGEKEAVYTPLDGTACINLIAPWIGLTDYYYIGESIPENEFKLLLDFIYKAGDNLKECNMNLKIARALWRGRETFVI